MNVFRPENERCSDSDERALGGGMLLLSASCGEGKHVRWCNSAFSLLAIAFSLIRVEKLNNRLPKDVELS